MTDVWWVPELEGDFSDNFSQMLIDYIYAQWPYTSLTGVEAALNKPATMTGQTTTIEFRPGLKDAFKTLQVLTRQGRTVTVDHKQVGYKHEEMTTQVIVTTLVRVMNARDDTSPFLRLMDQAIQKICGMYRQTNQVSGDMRGVKDLIYEGSDRIYGPKDQFDKSDWQTDHSILLWYTKVHGEAP